MSAEDLTGSPAADVPGGMGRRALRNTALVLAARVVSRLVALVTVVAIGNSLGDTRFGEFQTAVTYGALIGTIADVGLSTLYVREGARQPAAIARFLTNVVSVKVILTVLSLPLLAGALWVAGLTWLTLPCFVMVVLSGYSLLLRNTLYALQRLGFEAAEIVPESLVLLGLVGVGLGVHAGVDYYLWAYALSYAFATLYFVIVLWRANIARPRWELDVGFLRPWFAAGVPLAVTYVLTTVYFKADVPILQRYRPYDEVGWYTFAYKPFESLLFIPMTVRTIIFPTLSVYHRASPNRVLPLAEKFFKALFIMGLPCTVGIALLAPQLNDLLHLFPQSAAALRILGLAVVFLFVDNTFAATFNAIDRQTTFAGIALFGLALNVVLNLVLAPPFGYLGAAWAVVLTEVALVSVGLVVLRRHLGSIRIVPTCWRVAAAGGIMGLAVVAMHPLGRLHVVGAICVAAVVYGLALWGLKALDAEERSLLLGAVRR